MFFVMYEHEGEIKLVAREVFTSFEAAEEYAKKVEPKFNAFVVGKVEK